MYLFPMAGSIHSMPDYFWWPLMAAKNPPVSVHQSDGCEELVVSFEPLKERLTAELTDRERRGEACTLI